MGALRTLSYVLSPTCTSSFNFVIAIYPTPPSSSRPSSATGPPFGSPSVAAATRSPPSAAYHSHLRPLPRVASYRTTRLHLCWGYCPAGPAKASTRTKMQTSSLQTAMATPTPPSSALPRAYRHRQRAAAASFVPVSTPAARADARQLDPARTQCRYRCSCAARLVAPPMAESLRRNLASYVNDGCLRWVVGQAVTADPPSCEGLPQWRRDADHREKSTSPAADLLPFVGQLARAFHVEDCGSRSGPAGLRANLRAWDKVQPSER